MSKKHELWAEDFPSIYEKWEYEIWKEIVKSRNEKSIAPGFGLHESKNQNFYKRSSGRHDSLAVQL